MHWDKQNIFLKIFKQLYLSVDSKMAFSKAVCGHVYTVCRSVALRYCWSQQRCYLQMQCTTHKHTTGNSFWSSHRKKGRSLIILRGDALTATTCFAKNRFQMLCTALLAFVLINYQGQGMENPMWVTIFFLACQNSISFFCWVSAEPILIWLQWEETKDTSCWKVKFLFSFNLMDPSFPVCSGILFFLSPPLCLFQGQSTPVNDCRSLDSEKLMMPDSSHKGKICFMLCSWFTFLGIPTLQLHKKQGAARTYN